MVNPNRRANMPLKPLISATSSDSKSESNAMAALLRANDYKFETMLPAIVINFDRTKNIATVQPLITWVDMSDNARARNQYADLPVLSIGGGGFHISFPLTPGDLGWIKASDRDISQFTKTLRMAKPNSGRSHKFEDGLFIPDVFRQYVINSEDSGAMVIQSTSGATRISLRGDNIKITTPNNITLDTPQTNITGNVRINGNVVMDKTLIVATEATVAGIAVTKHGHISSAPGARTANGMIA